MAGNLKELHIDLQKTNLYFKSYNLLFLSQVYISEHSYGLYKRLSFVGLLKRFSLDNVVKLISYKVHSPLSRRKPQMFEYLFINDVNNKPVYDVLDSIRRKFDKQQVGTIFFDSRLGKANANCINGFEFCGIKFLFISLFDILKSIPSIIRYRSEVRHISKKYKLSTILLLLNLFESIFSINAILLLVANISSPKVILMTDVHKLSRIVTLTLKDRGSYTFVIQHGAVVGEEGYLPVLADKMLVWGSGSKNWFLKNGQMPSKLEIVGSPKMDKVRYLKPENLIQNANVRRILVIVSTITLEQTFLEVVRDAVLKANLLAIEVYIKLHPGTKIDYSYIVDEVFRTSRIKYKTFKYEKLEDLIINSDLAILTSSTAGIDAVVHNKPLYQYKSDRLKEFQMDWEQFECSHLFETSDQLAAQLLDNASRFSKLVNYSSFLMYTFGKLEGNASSKVREYIAEYPA